MSIFFSWRSAFQKSNLPPTTKLVLFCISTYMNDHGEGAFPSIKTLMIDTSLSNRAVITHIKHAEEKGFLKVSKHGFAGRSWMRNQYEISMPVAVNEVHRNDDEAVNLTTQGSEPHDIEAVNEVHTITPVNSPLITPVEKKNTKVFYKRGTLEDETLFLEWWEEYPADGNPQTAREEFKLALNRENFDKILSATKEWAKAWEGYDKLYIIKPENWLKKSCWNAALPVQKEKPFDPSDVISRIYAESEHD